MELDKNNVLKHGFWGPFHECFFKWKYQKDLIVLLIDCYFTQTLKTVL